MSPRASQLISSSLLSCGLAGLVAFWLFPLSVALSAALLAGSLGLLLAANLIAPPFWWQWRKFTTRLVEPSHVQHIDGGTTPNPTVNADAPKAVRPLP